MTAIPETLVESELFGYVKGAFTGADRNKKGFIEAAEGGTLFLDEIGDLAPAIQLKLLRFLETRQYYRVGESTAKTSDVRIVAATNKELEEAIQGTGFRKDLYFRLNGITLSIPPLRERRTEILPLAAEFAAAAAAQLGRKPPQLDGAAQSWLVAYAWPGNVRELKNVIERAAIMSEGDELNALDLGQQEQVKTSNLAVEGSANGSLMVPYTSDFRDDRREFERLLRAAIAIDVSKRPSLRLANLIAQKHARYLLTQMDRLFK